MRDVRLDLDIPDAPMMAMGDRQLVRLALLSLAISVIELTSPGGRVRWRTGASEALPGAWIAITTSSPTLPHALAGALFRLSCTAESEYSAAIAARLVVEAQGGEVELRDATGGGPGIFVRMPGRA
jgi:hypothetical protein